MYAAGKSSPYKEPCKESADRDFDAIEGIERLDPMDWLATEIEAEGVEDDSP